MNFLLRGATLTAVSFIALHQTPDGDASRYKSYKHFLRHRHGGILGTPVQGDGTLVKRGNLEYAVRGYVCHACGHVDIYKVVAEASVEHPLPESATANWNNSWKNRVQGELWASDKEWCDALRDISFRKSQ